MSRPAPGRHSPATLDDPLYYLQNFRWVLEWVVGRYGDLLTSDEHRFASTFQTLPTASQGLFVRMVMRKGDFFRADKLSYSELGCTREAVEPLLAQGWVSAQPRMDLDTLFKVFTWVELRKILAPQLHALEFTATRKGDALTALKGLILEPATPVEWGAGEAPVYQLTMMPVCDRFRLMFFGNLHQDWSEFVLAELGTFLYEPVDFSNESRPFHSRAEVDNYLALQACRERFYQAEALDATILEAVVESLPVLSADTPWLLARRDRLLFKIAREWERSGELHRARALYTQCTYPGARARLLRVLEGLQEYEQALTLALRAQGEPESEAELQQLGRMLPRLHRKLGLARPTATRSAAPSRLDLILPYSAPVELAVKQTLETENSPVFYVENSLLTGLFGLLCWDAIFAALPGAFFHPFQRGPADLHWPTFYQRRADLFDACLQLLDTDDYRTHIGERFAAKYGRQSNFVHWGLLSETLITQALECIPRHHLRLIFARMLRDLKTNCAGFPDLIQFWPETNEYRMIEVKGPGDQLQDNQRRWLAFFSEHDIPVTVCYVRWQTQAVAER